LSDVFPIKNGLKEEDDFSPWLFSFALAYAIRGVQENQSDLKLNGTHLLLFYADDVNILGESVHTVEKKTEILVVVIKDIGLEVNTDETKCTIMYRDQNVRRGHNRNFDNSLFEIVEQFKYLGTTLRNKYCIRKEIKSM
jgi:hypothetical protein